MLSESEILKSALAFSVSHGSVKDILYWLEEKRRNCSVKIKRIAFSQMNDWEMEASTGDLVHRSRLFFKVRGITVNTNYGAVAKWSQPIILQPEIGILGLLAKRIDGIVHFLVQAKMEPGNLALIQLAPTVQATKSNIMKAHLGGTCAYLGYFQKPQDHEIIVDVLQTEQGARFLRKQNRNMIVMIDGPIELADSYRWMSLGQIMALMRHDHTVNMDLRSVLSCVFFEGRETEKINNECLKKNLTDKQSSQPSFERECWRSIYPSVRSEHTLTEVMSWYASRRMTYDLSVDPIGLRDVEAWNFTNSEIHHKDYKYFKVVAIEVENAGREVDSWSQPMIQPQQSGLVAFITQKRRGVMHFLAQAKLEAGNLDVLAVAPTVQCITGSYAQVPDTERPPFLNWILRAPKEWVRLDVRQSEEGGRFFKEENRNMIVEAPQSLDLNVPEDFIWLTLGQLQQFCRFNHYVNVQARSLMAALFYRSHQ